MNQHSFNTDDELDDDFKDLERLLGELRFVPRPLDLDAVAPRAIVPSQVSRFSFTRYPYAASLAAGIVLTFAVAALWFNWFMPTSSIIVESDVAPSVPESSIAANTSPAILNVAPPLARSGDIELSRTVSVTQSRNTRRLPRLAHSYPKRRAKSAGEVVANSTRASSNPTLPRSVQAEEAAQELLLALDVTQRSLDATRRQIESHISAVRIPVFPYPTQQ